MISLICAWTNDWANNRDAGDLRRHRALYDITVMPSFCETNGDTRPRNRMKINAKKFNVPNKFFVCVISEESILFFMILYSTKYQFYCFTQASDLYKTIFQFHIYLCNYLWIFLPIFNYVPSVQRDSEIWFVDRRAADIHVLFILKSLN